MGKKYTTSESLSQLKKWSWELKIFNLKYNFIDSTATFFANPKSAHERCQFLVARAWWSIYEPLDINQRFTRIGDLYSIIEDFY